MRNLHVLKFVVLASLLGVGQPLQLGAQETVSADSILVLVASGADGHQMGAGGLVQRVLLRPEEFGPGVRGEVVDGLEAFLTDEVGTSEFRQSVAAALAQASSTLASDPLLGTVSRLEAIYDRTPDPALKLIVVGSLFDTAEQEAAADFLGRVARGEGEPAGAAVVGLQRLGAPGRTVLASLHAQSSVSDPWARELLQASAKRGFRPAKGNTR